MRRLILPLTVFIGLGLVGCGTTNTSEPSADSTITPAKQAESGETKGSEDKNQGEVGALNAPFEISTLDDNEVYLNIKEVTLGAECKFGMHLPEWPNDEVGEGKQYLQVLAEVDVERLDNPRSRGFVYLDSPKVVDNEGFTQDAESGSDCQDGDGYESWLMPTAAGDKTRRYGYFIVPSDLKEVRIHGKTFKVEA